MKLLHIDSSITGADSITRQVTAAAVRRLRDQIPDLEVTYRDVAAEPTEHLTIEALMAAGGPENAVLAEFLAADIVVVGAPMYNYTVPSTLKAWLDRILIPGVAFRYSENGPEGLLGDKRVIVAVSRGSVFAEGGPAAALEHVETYLRSAFGLVGITPEFLIAEGVKTSPEQAARALDGALAEAQRLAA